MDDVIASPMTSSLQCVMCAHSREATAEKPAKVKEARTSTTRQKEMWVRRWTDASAEVEAKWCGNVERKDATWKCVRGGQRSARTDNDALVTNLDTRRQRR